MPPSEEARSGDPQDTSSPVDRATLIGELTDQGEAFLWGHHRLPLLCSPVEDENLFLEFTNATPRGRQLRCLRRREPRTETSVDLVLAPPVVDRGVTQVEFAGNLLHGLAGPQQGQHSSSELRWVGLRHDDPFNDQSMTIPDSRLH